jgi:hypothetical protein
MTARMLCLGRLHGKEVVRGNKTVNYEKGIEYIDELCNLTSMQ